MEFHNRLKQRRKELGFTQEDISLRIMVSRQTISNWETGKTLPDISSLIFISDIYQISLDTLIKGDEKIMNKVIKDSKSLQIWLIFACLLHAAFCIALNKIPKEIGTVNVLTLVIAQVFFTAFLVMKGYGILKNEGKVFTVDPNDTKNKAIDFNVVATYFIYFDTLILGFLTPFLILA